MRASRTSAPVTRSTCTGRPAAGTATRCCARPKACARTSGRSGCRRRPRGTSTASSSAPARWTRPRPTRPARNCGVPRGPPPCRAGRVSRAIGTPELGEARRLDDNLVVLEQRDGRVCPLWNRDRARWPGARSSRPWPAGTRRRPKAGPHIWHDPLEYVDAEIVFRQLFCPGCLTASFPRRARRPPAPGRRIPALELSRHGVRWSGGRARVAPHLGSHPVDRRPTAGHHPSAVPPRTPRPPRIAARRPGFAGLRRSGWPGSARPPPAALSDRHGPFASRKNSDRTFCLDIARRGHHADW